MKTRIKAKNLHRGDIILGSRNNRIRAKFIHGNTVMAVVYDRNKPISKTFNMEDYVKIKRPKFNIKKKSKKVKKKTKKVVAVQPAVNTTPVVTQATDDSVVAVLQLTGI